MLELLDKWAGKNLFIPIIIRFCQMTGMSQYSFAHYGAMLVGWAILANLLTSPLTLWLIVLSTLIGLAVLYITCVAALDPGRPVSSHRFMRYLFLIFLISDVALLLLGIAAGFELRWKPMLFDLGILFVEYASTIDTIPPTETRETSTEMETSEA